VAGQKTGKQQIAEWLSLKQESLGLSIRGLAEAIGVSDSTMRIYLDPTHPHDPQPDLLRRIAEFLGMDDLTMFIIAYDLADPQVEMDVSEYYVLDLYRRLSDKNQEVAVSMLQTLAGETQEAGEFIQEAITEGRQLRHRQLGRLEDMLRAIAAGFRLQTEYNLVGATLSFLDKAGCTATEEEVRRVTNNQLSIAIMNVLLPRKDMPAWEKLTYLVFPEPNREQYPDNVSEQTKQEIRDTWELLLRAAERET
jgi:transcriptional regulator with XRE-family HTH domain